MPQCRVQHHSHSRYQMFRNSTVRLSILPGYLKDTSNGLSVGVFPFLVFPFFSIIMIDNIEESETQHFLPAADHDSDSEKKPLPNTLPKLQFAIVLLLQICEPITSQSIYPYINQVRLTLCRSREASSYHLPQLITEFDITGGDHRKVGYYAGLMVG